jgi:probable FeS assembly SUF system protein SufT
MPNYDRFKLKRDCDATQIPSGLRMRLREGTEVAVTQSLGGSYTVITDEGYMVRVDGKDADALGLEAAAKQEAAACAEPESQAEVEKMVWARLKTCFDPEIPVNIVDLGLVYECCVSPLEAGGYRVGIKMTLTAPGCGMGEVLRADVDSKVRSIPGVKTADVGLVWDPPWDRDKLSEAAKLQLGLL